MSIRSWGRQFFTCGGPSSSFSRANRAADIDKPRMPSPHSFSALQISIYQFKLWCITNISRHFNSKWSISTELHWETLPTYHSSVRSFLTCNSHLASTATSTEGDSELYRLLQGVWDYDISDRAGRWLTMWCGGILEVRAYTSDDEIFIQDKW